MDEHPIQHLVVLAHPRPSSFNHGIAEAYCAAVRGSGQVAILRDLHAMDFDPVLKPEELPGTPGHTRTMDIESELSLLRRSAVVTLVYPIWFGMPPAMLKGYIDRVLGAGFEPRRLKAREPHSMLHGKRLLILSSSASSLPWLNEMGQWEALRQAFDTYLTTIFGMRPADHVHFDAVVPNLSARYAEECLGEAEQLARGTCAEVLSERRAHQLRTLLHRTPA